MIELKNISKTFGETQAVKNISFSVKKGETLVLLGTSGCGKTTTLKMINRLIEPENGEIFINGENIKTIQEEKLRLGIGYVLQNHGLFPHFTIAQNIAIVPKLLKWDNDKINKRTNELLEKLHLPLQIKEKYPNQLSGGQQQRVGLARALMANPPILLMDEPLGALDPITRNQIRQEFLTLDELLNKTIVMVTHDVEEAFELGDRICLMNEGEILQMGYPNELLTRPKNQLVSNFLEGHKLKLSLKTVSLISLWDFFPNHKSENLESLNAESFTVWSALDILQDKKTIHLNFKGEQKNLDAIGLVSALEKYKQNGTE
ncbi:glycine/betaine ABC transporter ATP-binding protein [Pedobacter psychrophilus]|uniref:Glycine/betaine ABC transporter ATP-binding protein n=1 Tax=Pedobacter psychrophilus TaxID=1826909 RepID=A0A179DBT6_9SPHI|nr:ABC transporter ATP-binding protein [Pedobacter psychrophilus]OAQ38515.1 glycine/betaine ABC transporter ATP-binding protein [Pedobacter psychrophilus]